MVDQSYKTFRGLFMRLAKSSYLSVAQRLNIASKSFKILGPVVDPINFFLLAKNFLFLLLSYIILLAIIFSICNKHSSLTAKMGKRRKKVI